jgi:hypothetical protein
MPAWGDGSRMANAGLADRWQGAGTQGRWDLGDAGPGPARGVGEEAGTHPSPGRSRGEAKLECRPSLGARRNAEEGPGPGRDWPAGRGYAGPA